MKRVLGFLLSCLLLLCLPACTPKTPQLDQLSTTTEAATTTTTTTVPTQTLTKAQAEKIAKEKVDDYFIASVFGVCCEIEYAEGDMSRFLTDEQLHNYPFNQWKITCCSTPAEVKAHLYRTVDGALLNDNVDDLLFFDDQQNLYVMVPGRGIDPHDDIAVTDYSATHITATANLYCMGEPRELAGRYHFTLENRADNFVITNVTYVSVT